MTAQAIRIAVDAADRAVLQPASHGGFDNDIDVIARPPRRIAGADPVAQVDDLRGY